MSYTTPISPASKLELRKLQNELQTYIDKGNKLTRSEAKRVDALIAQISAIKKNGVTDIGEYRDLAIALADELGLARPDFSTPVNPEQRAHQTLFKNFMCGAPDSTLETEYRSSPDFLAGTQSVSYFTPGGDGGVLVPQSFQNSVVEGLAQVDPLLDPNICTVIPEPGLKLPPLTIPGWDLSTIEAVQVAEGAQHNSDVVPGITKAMLNKFTYRLSLGASFEWEQDQRAFDSAMATMGRAFGVGFARGIGRDLILGNGSSAPAGILATLTSKFGNITPGIVTADDIENAYFALDRIHRAAPKCAWLMSDAAYKKVRQARDSSQRPLINVVDDQERLMGKPIYICPSLPLPGTSQTGSFAVFGDLSHYHVHVSTLLLRRRLQAPGYIENAKALFTGLMSVDAELVDPSDTAPAVIAGSLQ